MTQFADDFGYDLDEEGPAHSRPTATPGPTASPALGRQDGLTARSPEPGLGFKQHPEDHKGDGGGVGGAAEPRRQRISMLRPYADALRRMTRQAAADAGAEASRLPLLARREHEQRVGIVLVTSDRGLAGAFNSQIFRAGVASAPRTGRGRRAGLFASGRRGVSSLTFRGLPLPDGFIGFTDRPPTTTPAGSGNAWSRLP